MRNEKCAQKVQRIKKKTYQDKSWPTIRRIFIDKTKKLDV